MFCGKCGAAMEVTDSFCTSCGAAKSAIVAAAPGTAAATPAASPVSAGAATTLNSLDDSAFEAAPSSTYQAMINSSPGAYYYRETPAFEVAQTNPLPVVNFDKSGYVSVPIQAEPQTASKSKRTKIIVIVLIAVLLLVATALAYVIIADPFSQKNDSTVNGAVDSSASGSEDSPSGSNSPSAGSSSGGSGSGSSEQNTSNNPDATAQDRTVNDYVFPDSNTRLLTKTEVSSLSEFEMLVARNEIYARYGREFKTQGLADHFSSKSWYVKKYTAEEFDSMPSPLNSTELTNISTIQEVETENGYS
jgi:hypothetical protein